MKKPWWEETWVLDAKDPESGPAIGLEGGGVLFECNDATRATGAAAAPEMAMALREVLTRVALPSDLNIAVRAALLKAGVPIP